MITMHLIRHNYLAHKGLMVFDPERPDAYEALITAEDFTVFAINIFKDNSNLNKWLAFHIVDCMKHPINHHGVHVEREVFNSDLPLYVGWPWKSYLFSELLKGASNG